MHSKLAKGAITAIAANVPLFSCAFALGIDVKLFLQLG